MVIIFIPVTGICAVFAFYKPNGMKFSRFFSSFVAFSFKPRLYVWKQEERTKSLKTLKESEKENKSGGLKNKKGGLETGSKVDEKEINKTGVESEYLDEILNQ